MRTLMKFAMDSKLGTLNPELDLSPWRKKRFLDDATNRHGMEFKQRPYFQSLTTSTVPYA